MTTPASRTFIIEPDALPWIGYKAPEEIKNFSFDWSQEIGTDLIIRSRWKTAATDLTILNANVDASGTFTTVLLENGSSNSLYQVTNGINTASGLALIATFVLNCTQSDLGNFMTFNNNNISGTITTGGTAQVLLAASTGANGYSVYNPDSTNDLWISESGNALANASGSVRIPANGGWYEQPPGSTPALPVSIVGAVTGQKFTARWW
jgi:hypothetical protein